jgi:hypothetical protein
MLAVERSGTGSPPWGRLPVGAVFKSKTHGTWDRIPGPSGSGARWWPRQFDLFQDFIYDASATLPLPWGKQDTSAAGAPVTDFVADAIAGHYVLALAADNEVETLTLYLADQLVFDITKLPIMGIRLKVASDVTGAGGLFAAGDKLVAGLASARNATLDSVVTHAWYRMEGANHNLLCETDDGTTDNDDNDTTVDWAEDTFLDLVIDCSVLGNIRFVVNDANVTPEAMNLSAATGNVQPFVELQKAAAANKDHKVTVDHVWIKMGSY